MLNNGVSKSDLSMIGLALIYITALVISRKYKEISILILYIMAIILYSLNLLLINYATLLELALLTIFSIIAKYEDIHKAEEYEYYET